jgi:hypothetical protein
MSPAGEVTSTATCMTFGGLDAGTGLELTTAQSATRVGWLADLVSGIGSAIVAEHCQVDGVAPPGLGCTHPGRVGRQ